MKTLFSKKFLGQPFMTLPASSYVPAGAILPTSNPQMFPMVTMPPTMPPGAGPVILETYTTPAPEPSYTPLYAAAGIVGLGLLALAVAGR